ncbi:ATP-binding protein [Streptosporangium sp. NPDC051022]|uniref:ATP-binding protein n=1 Tax=Streptosporangium sp. NPDC051022 TaxID=3155752 RepID=UPI00343AAB52
MSANTLGVVDLPGVKQSVSAARRYVAGLLTDAGHVDVEDAVLLVSEVVTNAVVHTSSGRPGGVVTVEITHQGPDSVCIEVIDDGSPSVPKPRHPDEGDLTPGGRGLWLVDAIATKWGVRPVEQGRVAVWMEITTAPKTA